MILLKDLFSSLATGEFSNISLQRDRSGNINESEYGKILDHINLGLIDLHKRFRLLEEELVICADPAVQKYHLRPQYLANPGETTNSLYIERPENHDGQINIVEIKALFDEEGTEMVMNNRHKSPAILQIATDTLKITKLEEAQKFAAVFQAYPSRITLDDDLDPDVYVLHIPETIVEPLLYYVASRVYKPMGTNDSTANADKSSSYQQQYELACQRLQYLGLDIAHDDSSNTFYEDGWV